MRDEATGKCSHITINMTRLKKHIKLFHEKKIKTIKSNYVVYC